TGRRRGRHRPGPTRGGPRRAVGRRVVSAPTLPYGSWPSPITAASLVEQAVSIGQVEVDGERVYWLEGRPSEGGRQVVVRWAPGEEPRDAIPEAGRRAPRCTSTAAAPTR